MTITATFVLLWSEHAPGLPTDLKHTLHTVLEEVATNTVVVGWVRVDAEEPDTSKSFSGFSVGCCINRVKGYLLPT